MEKEKFPKNAAAEETIPILEEELQVGKREVETGVTRVSIKVNESEEVIEQPLMQVNVEIQHVPINRFVDHPVEMRTEGDVTIIPVMEEVLVVEKKLRLKEELHIRRRSELVPHTQKESLRKEEVVVEHIDLPE